MEILGKLGIDPMLLIAQIINFCLLLWFLNRFFYKPLLKHLHRDEADLQRGHTAIQPTVDVSQITKEQAAKIIQQSKLQARAIVKEAEEIAQGIRQAPAQKPQTRNQTIARPKTGVAQASRNYAAPKT